MLAWINRSLLSSLRCLVLVTVIYFFFSFLTLHCFVLPFLFSSNFSCPLTLTQLSSWRLKFSGGCLKDRLLVERSHSYSFVSFVFCVITKQKPSFFYHVYAVFTFLSALSSSIVCQIFYWPLTLYPLIVPPTNVTFQRSLKRKATKSNRGEDGRRGGR